MAANAIGKISFQVVADTSRVDRNLGESAKSFQRYATAINRTISGASAGAAKQFNAILTPLQRLNEALNQGTGRLQFRGLEQSRQQIEQLALASREVAKPLADVAKSFDSLSLGVQGAFVPALKSAQDEVRSLETSITGGRGAAELSQQFERASASVEKTSAAVSRLRSLSSLTESLQTGNEATFTSPRLVEQLRRSSQLQSAASSLPAGTIESDRTIRSFTIAIKEASNEALVLSANLERAILAGSDTSQIEASLARVINRQREYNDALERQISGNSSQQARAQFASQFLQVDQRESDLIANQGLATDVSERVRLIAQVQQREREFAEAREDAARRAQAASRLLVVDQLGSEIASNQGARTDLQPGTLQRSAERTAAQQVGAGVDTTIRQLDQLAQRVQGVRGQIDSLPATIGTGFIPQLQRAEQEFIRLRSSGRATAEEIENASNNVEQLAAQVRRVGAAQGLRSFADGLDDTALRGAIGNLQALQQILNRVGATAGSEAANQFDRMRAAIQRATRDGTIGSEAFQRELRQLSQEAANAAAATGRIGRAAAFREIQRGGDIARGGFDKLSLATQQAAFAIDDFFSATGDFTQKIRAVQNNVTQLAFILGGTTGLFIGLGVAIAAQAAVALFKWSQGTVDAEDKTQALNDALARQKGLVEELKQAFDSLGDSLTRGIFDEATEQARKFSRQLDAVEEAAARQLEFAAAVDPRVQEQRGIQSSLQSQLEESSDGVERARLQREIDQARGEEANSINRLRQESLSITPEDVLREIADSIGAVAEARAFAAANTGLGLVGLNQGAVDQAFRVGDVEAVAAQQAFADLGAELGDDLLAAERILSDRLRGLDGNLKDLRDSVNPVAGLFNSVGLGEVGGVEGKALNNEADLIGRLLEQVRFKIADENSKIITGALSSAGDVSQTLRDSLSVIQSDLGESRFLSETQKGIASELAIAIDSLKGAAGEDGRLGTGDDTLTRSEIEERKHQIDILKAEADSNLSAIRSTQSFAKTLDRVAGELAETVSGEARSAASQARRDANRAIAEAAALPDDATPEQRLSAKRAVRQAEDFQKQSEANAKSIEDGRRRLQADRQASIEFFELRADRGELGGEIEKLISDRNDLRREVEKSGDATDRANLAEIEAELADAFEQTAAARALKKRADALDQEQKRFEATRNRRQQQEEQLQQSVQRGQDLLRTPEQRAAEEGVRSFNDAINASVDGIASQLQQFAPNIAALEDGRLTLSELSGVFAQFPALREQFIQDLQVARENLSANISAQIAQFDAERARPSRAALQAQDVNTQQGRAELNRLLRGDDASRDQPVLQGIKEQTAVLKTIDRRIDEVRQAVGLAGI